MNDSVSDTDEFLIQSHQTAQSAHCALLPNQATSPTHGYGGHGPSHVPHLQYRTPDLSSPIWSSFRSSMPLSKEIVSFSDHCGDISPLHGTYCQTPVKCQVLRSN